MNFYGNSILPDGFRLSDNFRDRTEYEIFKDEDPKCKWCGNRLTLCEWQEDKKECDECEREWNEYKKKN